MRKLIVVLTATAAVLLAGSLAFKADAQTLRGAANISTQTQNFTPIEQAACGPHWGRWCGPFHRQLAASLILYQTCNVAIGTKRTFQPHLRMSALPGGLNGSTQHFIFE